MADKFNYVKRGYSPSEVDSYVESLEGILRSYKEKDSAIKDALVSAQIAADNIIKNAELEAERMKRDTLTQLNAISQSVSKQKDFLKSFQQEYNLMVERYLTNFNERDLIPIYAKINDIEEYLFSLQNYSEGSDELQE